MGQYAQEPPINLRSLQRRPARFILQSKVRLPQTNSATLMMTKEHPRIEEFLDEMAGSHGLDLHRHCDLDRAHFGRCDGKPGRPLTKRILSRMDFTSAQLKQTFLYFDSSNLACDCAVYLDILNVEGAYEAQLSEYRRVLASVGASAYSG